MKFKNPTCFGQSSDNYQGFFPLPCAITTYQPACLIAFQSVVVCCLCVYTCDVPVSVVSGCVHMCTHPDTTLTGTSQVYTDRQHTTTDWNATRQAGWHVIAQGTGKNLWWWSEDWPKHGGFFNLILSMHHRHF